MELSSNYKKSKRAKSIFSVLSSASRIDILKILNSKGALTYSELKAYAGFKSKKESGKFAYHLRQLLKNSLISLNKGEKKYTITNFGKTVLNLVKQVEERSIIESGKIYLRRHDRLEELDAHKVAQILVRNTNMPPELANKIADEVEAKILRFEVSYLTESLLIEIINSTLIEHGYEEYREKLASTSISLLDLSNILANSKSINELAMRLSSKMLSEYMLFSYMPKDITDQHLEGNININCSYMNSILPDTVFIDASKVGIKDASSLVLFANKLASEAAKEVVFYNIDVDHNDVARSFPLLHPSLARITFALDCSNYLLDRYKEYVKHNGSDLGLLFNDANIDTKKLKDILALGGCIAISKEVRSVIGVKSKKSIDIAIHSISLNLPRIAYESNKDEQYFRARLAMAIEPAIDAIKLKYRLVNEFIENNMLSTLNTINRSDMSLILNLADPYTAINKILEYDDTLEIIYRLIHSMKDKIENKDLKIGLAIVEDDSIDRFAMLDKDRYGRAVDKYNGFMSISMLDGFERYNEIDSMLDGFTIKADEDSIDRLDTMISNLNFVRL